MYSFRMGVMQRGAVFIRWIGIGNFSDVLALQMMIHTVPREKLDSSFVPEVWEYAPVKSVAT